jgi:hypothetical protein
MPLLLHVIVVENFSDIATQRPCYFSLILTMLYSLHPQMFVAFDFYINFDHSSYSKKSFEKNQI